MGKPQLPGAEALKRKNHESQNRSTFLCVFMPSLRFFRKNGWENSKINHGSRPIALPPVSISVFLLSSTWRAPLQEHMSTPSSEGSACALADGCHARKNGCCWLPQRKKTSAWRLFLPKFRFQKKEVGGMETFWGVEETSKNS